MQNLGYVEMGNVHIFGNYKLYKTYIRFKIDNNIFDN